MLRFFAISLLFVSTSLANPQDGYYRGILGSKYPIMVMLNSCKPGWAGQYRYTRYESPIFLKSISANDEQTNLEEYDFRDTHKRPAHLTAALDSRRNLVGTWTSADGSRVLEVELGRIADTSEFRRENSRYSVKRTVPQFLDRTPFYVAVNELLERRAEKSLESTAADFEKSKRDSDFGAPPWESTAAAEIIFANENLVSLCYTNCEDTGGAHGDTTYEAVTLKWHNSRLVELHNEDLIWSKAIVALHRLLIADLKRQHAAWADGVKMLELNDLVINPTREGLVFTFAPYAVDCFAAGPYTVMLPYTSLEGIARIPSEAVLRGGEGSAR